MTASTGKPSDSSRALGAGLTFAVTVALFALGGVWLDGKLATSPWFVLFGSLLGIVGGAIHVIQELAPGVLWSKSKSSSAGKGRGPHQGHGKGPASSTPEPFDDRRSDRSDDDRR